MSQPLLFLPTHEVLCGQVALVCWLCTAGRGDSPRKGGWALSCWLPCVPLSGSSTQQRPPQHSPRPAPLCHEEESSTSDSCNRTSLRLKTKPATRACCAQGTPAAPASPWILCRGRQFQGTVKVSDFEQSPSFINSFLKFHS